MIARSLVVTGGHDFDEDAFGAMLAATDISTEHVRWPEAEHNLATGADYDVFVFYDFGQEMSDAARTGFLGTLKGGAGLVVLHHAIYNHLSWPTWIELVGGCWRPEQFEISGEIYGPSTALVGQELKIRPTVNGHPITAGLSEFTLHDESYGGYYVAPRVDPLLETDHLQSGSLVAWAQDLGWTRTVYLQPGHGPETFRSADYRELLRRSVAWVRPREASE